MNDLSPLSDLVADDLLLDRLAGRADAGSERVTGLLGALAAHADTPLPSRRGRRRLGNTHRYLGVFAALAVAASGAGVAAAVTLPNKGPSDAERARIVRQMDESARSDAPSALLSRLGLPQTSGTTRAEGLVLARGADGTIVLLPAAVAAARVRAGAAGAPGASGMPGGTDASGLPGLPGAAGDGAVAGTRGGPSDAAGQTGNGRSGGGPAGGGQVGDGQAGDGRTGNGRTGNGQGAGGQTGTPQATNNAKKPATGGNGAKKPKAIATSAPTAGATVATLVPAAPPALDPVLPQPRATATPRTTPAPRATTTPKSRDGSSTDAATAASAP